MNDNTIHTGERALEILGETDVVTRFPPSPTGPFHVGSARTALFNYLFAQHHDGEMVMRFEDTDTERSKKEFEDDIREGLEWLGIEQFGPLFRQSERSEVYKSYLETLIDEDLAYVSQEDPEDDGEQSEVIRFRNPGKSIRFNDLVRGEIEFDTTDLGDFVIAKSMDKPLYHLAVVIDDYEMGVSHVIRGEDHISNTGRQILIQEAIDAPRPKYAHIPLILGPDKAKLSKRHGATSVNAYKEMGILPEALVNYLALLGWNPGDDREIFSLEALIEEFTLENVQKSPAVFDMEKLRWFNKQYINALSDHDFMHAVKANLPADIKKLPDYSPERLSRALKPIRERIEVLSEIEEMANNGDVEFYFEKPDYFAPDLLWRDEDSTENTAEYLEHVIDSLKEISEDEFREENVKDAVWDYASDVGRGNVLWPMRYALSGKDQSPGPFVLSEVLGKKESIERLQKAINTLRDAEEN